MHLTIVFVFVFFFFNDTATTEIYTLSLHDALPICRPRSPADSTAPGCSRCRATRHRGYRCSRGGCGSRTVTRAPGTPRCGTGRSADAPAPADAGDRRVASAACRARCRVSEPLRRRTPGRTLGSLSWLVPHDSYRCLLQVMHRLKAAAGV